MSQETAQKLAEIAEAMSTAGRKVSPMQVAAQLLEEAVGRLQMKVDAAPETADPTPADRASAKRATAKPLKPKLRENGQKPARRRKQA